MEVNYTEAEVSFSQGVEVNYTEAEVSFFVNLAISLVREWRSTIQRLR